MVFKESGPSGAEGEANKIPKTKSELTEPENYQPLEENEYPRYEVSSVYGGGGHVPATRTSRFDFRTKEEAKQYASDQIDQGFNQTLQVVEWKNKGEGRDLIHNLHVDFYRKGDTSEAKARIEQDL